MRGKKKWVIGIGLLVLAIVLSQALYIIRPGEVGVIFDILGGGVQRQETTEGLNVKIPVVQRVYTYNIKTQDYTMSAIIEEGVVQRDDRVRTVTSEGLYVGLDITVLYKIEPAEASNIRQNIGIDGQYQIIVVRPTIRSVIREVISSYEAADVYGKARFQVEIDIYDGLTTQLIARGVVIEEVLLRDVELPAQLVKAIEAKKQAEQEALRMQYVLEKERLEKERRIIEAEGIEAAQKIINESLTEEYLAWWWISNLENHESVVYLIDSDTGLPIFKEISPPE